MTVRQILIFVAIAMTLACGCSRADESKMITKDQLVQMFDNMSKNPGWDTSKPMLWGYFFTNSTKDKLEKVVPLLEKQGYRFVSIYLSDKENPKDPDLWWLHVEKVEIHTPDTLNQRNMQFYKFADEHGLGSYDGMDVGPAQ